MKLFEVVNLGLVNYQQAWDLQRESVKARMEKDTPDKLILCEHNHVYTFGKSADHTNLLISPAFLKNIGAETFEIERGGDITYHGPGQLVGYPILDLNELKIGVRKYVDLLEETLIQTLSHFGIQTHRIPELTGIWLKEGRSRKIAAIGIKISRGITMHGFALNVSTDLSYFNHIIPCGIEDKDVTTMSKELGRDVDVSEVEDVYVGKFKTLFGLEKDQRPFVINH